MGRGRPRKPSAQRRREGNAGNRPIPNEVQVGIDKPIIAPDWLDGYALEVFQATVQELDAAGLASVVDTDMIAQYAVAAQTARNAYEAMGPVVIKGHSGSVKDPAITAWKDAVSTMRQLATLMGITASSRSQLGALGKETGASAVPSIGESPRLRAVNGEDT